MAPRRSKKISFASKDNSSRPFATDAIVRELLLVMPRLVGRAKRLGVPDALRSLDLAPRHLSLLSYLVFDGPLTISQRALSLGATLLYDRSADPQEPLYVYADPSGHPFCIFVSPSS
jgi:hypothetical protein